MPKTEQRSQPQATRDPWEIVQLARDPQRPYTLDYVNRIFERFVELHGDRRCGDDGAMVVGMGFLEDQPVAVVGQQKGRTASERRERNFGMARPEGYRKALRMMEMAARFERPLVTLIDTPGADCLEDSEGRGISEAIACNQRAMFALPVPIVSVVIGEGGSGGAIGIGVGDRVYMQENTYYSVIMPEACAAILWRDPSQSVRAAEALKLSPGDAMRLGLIDGIIAEPGGGAQADYDGAANLVRTQIVGALEELRPLAPEELKRSRYQKFREMGKPE
ncbi:MAG: acetyl-CoA carboxylase carboxyltransferase subunit alpha [candidate division WS1 bacterium]|nr:acetyl-CoA carboxylase carboxyltransferase subunit alpha [candidate division WS1 bacterium]